MKRLRAALSNLTQPWLYLEMGRVYSYNPGARTWHSQREGQTTASK